MAVWQYDVSLVPRSGVVLHHGGIPEELPGYRAVMNPDEMETGPFPNYWDNGPSPEVLAREIAHLLPPAKSWSADAIMFGPEDGHRLEIWKTGDIQLRFDAGHPDFTLLRAFVEFAQRHDLLCVSDTRGQPIEPTYESILADLLDSNAVRFCKDPEAYLKSLPRNQSG
ncbi:MAG TPA: hypothetical protein VFZ59_15550 [Verrucomicrobiae bacterium]|nr:hypothetical protein [Verrucomicrobiae bacterium]